MVHSNRQVTVGDLWPLFHKKWNSGLKNVRFCSNSRQCLILFLQQGSNQSCTTPRFYSCHVFIISIVIIFIWKDGRRAIIRQGYCWNFLSLRTSPKHIFNKAASDLILIREIHHNNKSENCSYHHGFFHMKWEGENVIIRQQSW